MLSRQEKREKKELENELLYFLSYYNEIMPRASQEMKNFIDERIEFITEKLKEIGH